MCLDELQLLSDDATFTEEHIIFLANKYRAFLLKKNYTDLKKEIPESNYQEVCLNLEVVNGVEGDECSNVYLRSIEKIPNMLPVGVPRISARDFLAGEITYVSRERMKYVGYNKWLKNIIYATLGPEGKLYLKSSNPQSLYLEGVSLSGIFEDPEEAAKQACEGTDGNDNCDILDNDYPLEEALIPLAIELIVKELGNSIYRPADEENNANDDLNNKTVNGRAAVRE